MGEKLYEFYNHICLKHVETSLRKALGHPPNVVTDEALFRQGVIDPGWQSLPAPIRMAGRDRMRWDDFFLAAR